MIQSLEIRKSVDLQKRDMLIYQRFSQRVQKVAKQITADDKDM
jgi:hypothetical protein